MYKKYTIAQAVLLLLLAIPTVRAHDGIALVDADGKVVQLVSYEGDFTAGSGPAKGMTAKNINSVHNATNGKQSLQLRGKGRTYEDFKWSPLYDKTPGTIDANFINDKQTFLKP